MSEVLLLFRISYPRVLHVSIYFSLLRGKEAAQIERSPLCSARALPRPPQILRRDVWSEYWSPQRRGRGRRRRGRSGRDRSWTGSRGRGSRWRDRRFRGQTSARKSCRHTLGCQRLLAGKEIDESPASCGALTSALTSAPAEESISKEDGQSRWWTG